MKIKLRLIILFLFYIIFAGSDVLAQIVLPAYQAVQYVNSAKVITTTISNIGVSTASGGGTISGSVGNIISRGICWSKTNSTPTLSNSKSTDGSGTGSFTSSLMGLGSGSTYYVRAYATNDVGTTYYGGVKTFTTTAAYGYLNYDSYSATTTITNANQMNTAVSGTAYSSGILIASTLIDFTSYTSLTSGGVGIPNSGDNFAIVASGLFKPSETGTYTFTCEGDDAVDLFINGVAITSQYGSNSASALGTHTGSIMLAAGMSYSFKARMKENAGNESLRVYWKKPSQSSGGTWYQDLTEVLPASGNITGDADGTTYYDGKLNFNIYSSGSSSPNSESEFDTYLNAATVYGSGSASAGTIINFSVYTDLVNAGIPIPNSGNAFSVVASGYFIPLETGTYTFTCEGDDAVDLFIDNVNVSSHYGGHAVAALGTHTGTISLTAGVKYIMKVRMQENAGDEVLKVFWKKPSQASGSTWFQNTGEISSQ